MLRFFLFQKINIVFGIKFVGFGYNSSALFLLDKLPDFMSSAAKNILYLVFVQGIIYLSPLLTLPYLTRTLEIEQFAALSFAQVFVQYFVLVTDYGFGITATRLIALTPGNIKNISEIVSNTLAVKLLLACLMAVVCVVLVCLIPALHTSIWLIAATFTGVYGNALFPAWLFQGVERMRDLALITALSRLLVLPPIFFFIHTPDDVVLAGALLNAPGLLAALMSFILLRQQKVFDWVPVSWVRMLDMLREGWHVFISNIFISLYTVVNLTLLKFLGTPEQVAFFAASDKIRFAIQGFIQPIASALFPRFAAMGRNHQSEEFKKLNRLGWISLVGTQIVGALVVFFGADLIAKYYFGAAFEGISIYLKAFAVLPVVIAVATVFAQWRLLALGEGVALSRVYMVAGPVHIVYAIIATSYWGWGGLLASVYLTEIMITLVMYFILRKKRIHIF
jgi:O-antigen/teichoic acid export membrane protein